MFLPQGETTKDMTRPGSFWLLYRYHKGTRFLLSEVKLHEKVVMSFETCGTFDYSHTAHLCTKRSNVWGLHSLQHLLVQWSYSHFENWTAQERLEFSRRWLFIWLFVYTSGLWMAVVQISTVDTVRTGNADLSRIRCDHQQSRASKWFCRALQWSQLEMRRVYVFVPQRKVRRRLPVHSL